MTDEKEKSRTEEMFSERAEEFRSRVRGLFPPEFRQHALAARKEFLLAVRSLIDARIESLEKAEKSTGRKATRIHVD